MHADDSIPTPDHADAPHLPDRSIAVLMPAAGSGQRFGTQSNKLFASLGGKPMWIQTLDRITSRPEVGRVVMAVSQEDRDHFASRLDSGVFDAELHQCQVDLVLGGSERSDSVQEALRVIQNDPAVTLVAVHDAARPLVRGQDLQAVFAEAAKSGAAILAAPLTATVKRDLGDRRRSVTVDRRELWSALTPQVFRVDLLVKAYQHHNGRPATDDAQLVERMGHDVALVPGSTDNLKITYPEDLLIAEAILSKQNQSS